MIFKKAESQKEKDKVKEIPKKEVYQTPVTPTINTVSKSFKDFQIMCDPSATTLQKDYKFETQFKGEYIQWTGIVSSIKESWGSYSLHVKHCSSTFTSDITIEMTDDQKNNLLKYREGDKITYQAKLNRFGEFLGLSASEGKVIQ